MELDSILKLLLALVAPYISVGFIKSLVRRIAEVSESSLKDLPHGLKLALGLGFSFIGFLLIKGGVLVGSDLPNGLAAAFLSLVAKGIYDLVHDLLKKL